MTTAAALAAAEAVLDQTLMQLALGLRAEGGARPAQGPRLAHTVALASSRSGEGTTVLLCHLARTLESSLGMKVAVMDANIAAPALHTVYGVSRCPGLSELLDGDATLSETLRITEDETLAILPVGKPIERGIVAPLHRPILHGIAEQLGRTGFDVLLVDCGPVLQQPETSSLAVQADIIYLVVRAESTLISDSEQALAALRSAGCVIGGVILNRVQQHVPGLLRRLR